MPSFATGSPLDYKIKRGLIIDTLKMLCLSVNRKRQYKNEKKAKIDERLHGLGFRLQGIINKAE